MDEVFEDFFLGKKNFAKLLEEVRLLIGEEKIFCAIEGCNKRVVTIVGEQHGEDSLMYFLCQEHLKEIENDMRKGNRKYTLKAKKCWKNRPDL